MTEPLVLLAVTAVVAFVGSSSDALLAGTLALALWLFAYLVFR